TSCRLGTAARAAPRRRWARSSRARGSPRERGPQDEQRDDQQRDRDERDVAAAAHLVAERVEAHAATVTRMNSLLVERADGVVTCTLNRPDKKNAITGEMWTGLSELFEAVATNADDRVPVITGPA